MVSKPQVWVGFSLKIEGWFLHFWYGECLPLWVCFAKFWRSLHFIFFWSFLFHQKVLFFYTPSICTFDWHILIVAPSNQILLVQDFNLYSLGWLLLKFLEVFPKLSYFTFSHYGWKIFLSISQSFCQQIKFNRFVLRNTLFIVKGFGALVTV